VKIFSSRWTRPVGVSILAAGMAVGMSSLADAAPTAPPIGNLAAGVADDGAHVVAETAVDNSIEDLTVDSPALGGDVTVRIVLPADWYSKPKATWPTLYMMPGAQETDPSAIWTSQTDFEQFMHGRNVLSVLPAEGFVGIATNYLNGPAYATFTAVELPQIMQRGFRSSGRNAITGVSTGGYSAMMLAADYPGEYKAAASYSGLLDTQFPLLSTLVLDDVLSSANLPSTALWGSQLFNASTWSANNPVNVTSQLRGIPLFVSFGSGIPGPYDNASDPLLTVESGFLESSAEDTDEAFLTSAASSGDTVTTDAYVFGTHTWPYGQREFQRSWPMLASALGVRG
jgi:S-formylglutathione hydrolase FrmB